MRAVVQRVSSAAVKVNDNVVSEIDKGFLVLLGIGEGDTEKEADILSRKIANLRVFEDENDKMNLSLKDVGGEILMVSQFTLMADVKKGNRPSFTRAMSYEGSRVLYEYIMDMITKEGITTKGGVFGAHMEVSLVNDGPVTIIYDTEEL